MRCRVSSGKELKAVMLEKPDDIKEREILSAYNLEGDGTIGFMFP
jgi:hypothetical protein